MTDTFERWALSSDGARIAYEIRGAGDLTVCFIHGWAGDRSIWAAQTAELASAFQVITVDLAGHGHSTAADRTWTVEGFAADVQAVLEREQPAQTVLVGHSFGGLVAMAVAATQRNSVLGVIGADSFTYTDFYPKVAEATINALVEPLIEDHGAFIDGLVDSYFTAASDLALVTRVKQIMSRLPVATAKATLEQFLAWDMEAELARLTVPVIAICSAPNLQVGVRERYAGSIDIHVIERVGHFVMMEAPDAFNAKLCELIATLRSC